ncbi:MAG TPA: TIM barrel protein [Pirellulales bacterium]|nr:TIM barrel protein [Pirellulales bacterium]
MTPSRRTPGLWLVLATACLLAGKHDSAHSEKGCDSLFARDNLVAWCIVPFDRAHRTPEERVAMLDRLGFKQFAYDWRAEHLPTFERELVALEKHKISLSAVWFPAALNDDARALLDGLRRHRLHTQLWVTMGDPAPQSGQEAKLAAATAALRPIAEEAQKIGCQVALYNHGGWFGEPENQLAVIDALGMPNVGIVYNLHHGHDHLDRFESLLKKMLPHLLALNLNGMDRGGDRVGRKILPLGQGEIDLPLLRTICASGYRGPIGILGHTMDDAEERLRDNLDGLDWLVPQLAGTTRETRPTPRTPVGEAASPQAGGSFPGRVAQGKPEYRQPPLTVECRVKLLSRDNYNILIASDTKASASHWEIFSMAGSGLLTAYLPGMTPDHVRSAGNICDGAWHDVAMLYEAGRVRLSLDGQIVADQTVEHGGKATVPGGLAIGRLVEGGIGCNGDIAYIRLTRGIREGVHRGDEPPTADERTTGLWIVDPAQRGDLEDRSTLKNTAKLIASTAGDATSPPPVGPNLKPADGALEWKTYLVDRSRDDAYLGVKVDSAGRVFVGAREAVYLFEPDGRGGPNFKLRQQVCRLPADSIVMGLEFRGDDLYVLTDNALYLLPRGRVELDVKPRRILWGLPLDLHVSFHCLAWGPEGDLYLTHGDPLLNYGDWSRPDHWGHWTLYSGPNGDKVSYTGVGAVLRVRPDGSRVRIVAGGLRGPVGLAFDPQWNLFTNDNDHESRADLYAPARLLHVTPHIDFAWPRGWMASKSVRRFDLVEPLTADLGRGVPCDLLSDGGGLLMARWDQLAVNRYPLAPRGASFSSREMPFLQGADFARPVGAAIASDGRLFITSLYLGGNVWSPHCFSDLIVAHNTETPDNRPLPEGVTEASPEVLWAELSDSRWQRRLAAHQEILRRGGPLLDEAIERMGEVDEPGPLYAHLPWLSAASGSPDAKRLLLTWGLHRHAELRRQAVLALTEFSALDVPDEWFATALDDADPTVQLAALAALFDRAGRLPVDAIARLASGDDAYLRQTAASLLSRRATPDDLVQLTQSSAAITRRAGVLAAGFRLTVPPADFVPPENLPLTYEAGNAAFTLTFADAAQPVDLRALGRVGSFTIAEWWKLVPHTSEQQQLFELLVGALGDDSTDVVDQAAYFLSLLNDSRAEPLAAEARRRVLAKQSARFAPRTINRAWVLGPIGDPSFSLEKVSPPDGGPLDLAATHTTATGRVSWKQTELPFDESDTTGATNHLYLGFQLQSTVRQPALVEVSGGEEPRIWHNGRATAVVSHAAALELQPGGNDLLVRVDRARRVGIQFRAPSSVVATVAEKVDFSLLAERLKQGAAGADRVPAELLSADWTDAVAHGDAQRGRGLFGSLGCTKCHGVTLDQPGGGAPNLADVRRRFTTAYVVESILLPSKQVADPFRGTTVSLADGRTVSGLVVNDADDKIELLLPDAQRLHIAKSEIEERAASPISPMPSGLIKTGQELRDLLAYLFSERPSPP